MSATPELTAAQSPAVLAFLQLLQGVSSTEDLKAKLCTDGQRRLLERAAVPRIFDRALVDTVLRRDLDDDHATWEWLIESIDVEAVGGHPGHHRVRDAVRKAQRERLLATLRSEPDRWARHVDESRRIADALDPNDPRQASERLYHLAIADPLEAGRHFVLAYDEADARGDFARCEHLLATLDNQLTLLEAIRTDETASAALREGALALQRTLDDRERLYSARRRFAEELRRSVHVLERDFMRTELAALEAVAGRDPAAPLDAEEQWIVNVESEGGRGKTAFLNWLIARHLVPRSIPVAKVDFDAPRWSNEHHQPWEFLLYIAQELDVQLRGAPLRTLIGEIESGLETPGQHSGPESRRHRHEVRNERLEADLAEDVPERLGRALAEATAGPVVIVLDTLEELKLRGLASLEDVVAVIDQVRTRCPKLRLYLVGRFSLEQRHAEMWASYGSRVRRVRIPNFEPDEARDFLMRLRGITSRPMALALAEKTDGLPLQLAIAADLVQARGLTLAQVRALRNIDLYYLVQRILSRIPQPEVRWLLRYGVVPKALTRDFVRDVMLPDLKQAMAGSTAHDDPALDPDELRALGQQFNAVLPSPEAPLDVESIWHALQGYASECSFVAADGSGGDALVFHADVRLPMRRVLQEQAARNEGSVFVRLHERAWAMAAEDADRAGDSDESAWAQAMARALYHGYQLSTERGEATWGVVIRRLATIRDNEAAERVAAELTLPEYLDDAARPLLRGDGEPMVRPQTLVQARFISARRSLLVAQELEGRQVAALEWWNRAREGLEAFDRLVADHGMHDIPRVDLALLRAEIQQFELTRRTASEREAGMRGIRRRLAAELRRASSGGERFRLNVAIAGLDASENPAAAIARLRTTLEHHARDGEVPRDDLLRALLKLVALCQQSIRVEEGLAAAEAALRLTRSGASGLHRSNILGLVAGLRWWLRDAERAVRDCATARASIQGAERSPELDSVLDSVLHLEGEAQVFRRDFEAVARVIEQTERAIAVARAGEGGDGDEARVSRLHASEQMLRCLRDQTQLRFADVGRSLELARTAYEKLADTERLMYLLLTELRFRFREEGDVRIAESLALRVGRTRAHELDASTVRARVLAAEVLAACGRGDASEEHWRELLSRVDSLDPARRVHVLVRAHVTRSGVTEPRALMMDACDALRAVTPVRLRVRLLAEQLHPLEELDLLPADRDRLERALGGRRAFDVPSLKPPTPSSLREALDVARVALVLGRVEACEAILAVLAPLARRQRFLAFLTMVQALELDAARHGYLPLELTAPDRTGSWQQQMGGGSLAGVALVQEGALHQIRGEVEAAAQLARQAEAILGMTGHPPTIWKAQAHELLALCSPHLEERRRARRDAIEYYALRGEQTQVTRLEYWSQTEREPDDSLIERLSPAVVVRVDRPASASGVAPLELMSARPAAPPVTVLPAADPVWLAMANDVSQRSSLGVPREALHHFTERWRESCTSMGTELQGALLRASDASAAPEPVDLDLQIGQAASLLQAVPWELALVPNGPAPRFLTASGMVRVLSRCPTPKSIDRQHAHVRWVQRMLAAVGQPMVADGIAGPGTLAALRAATGSDAPFEPATSKALIDVLARHRGVMRPRLYSVLGESSLTLRRGMRSRAAFEPASDQRVSLEGYSDVLTDPRDREQVTEALRGGEYDVVLLTGSMRNDHRRGGIVFDFAQLDHSTPEGGAGFDASQLSTLVWEPSRALRPIVIIDAQIGGGESERMRALFLRNAYCGELAAHETTAAVIGIGLESDLSSTRTASLLLQALRKGVCVADAVSDIHAIESDGHSTTGAHGDAELLHRVIPTRGIAVWSGAPRHVFVPSSVRHRPGEP